MDNERKHRKKPLELITTCIQPSKINRRYQNDKPQLPFTGEVVEIQPIDTLDNEELKTRSYRNEFSSIKLATDER